MLQVFVRGLDHALALDVACDDTLQRIKERVQEKTGVHPDAIALTLGGKPLPEAGPVRLHPLATLVAVPRLRTGGEVLVPTEQDLVRALSPIHVMSPAYPGTPCPHTTHAVPKRLIASVCRVWAEPRPCGACEGPPSEPPLSLHPRLASK